MQPPQHQHSLEADIATGWKPKMRIIGPMPLNFDNPTLDKLIKPLLYSDTCPHEVIYLGIRPRDTFEMHGFLARNYRYKFRHMLSTDYSHLKPFFRKFYSEFEPEYKLPFHGMNPKTTTHIHFQSRFESGNLDCVIRTKTKQYDLFLRIDSNTNGHIMWYYFKVSNQADQPTTVRLNICNLRRSKAFYDNSMQPYVQRQGVGWRQQANNLAITQQSIRFHREHLLFSHAYTQNTAQPVLYRKLAFDLELGANEEVEVAYSVPYTYSQLLNDIKDMKNEVQVRGQLEMEVNMANMSLSGLEIPYLKIYTKEGDKEEGRKKKEVMIIGRQHPGEANGSHVLKGFLQNLLFGTEAYARVLQQNFVFHVVPMLNPDGVVMGNFRTSLYGKDLNRLFRKSMTLMMPEVEFCKNLVFEITKKRKKKIYMFMDFHGHSFKKNAFCFAPGNFDLNSSEQIRDFPRIISENTEIFRFQSCSFRISSSKKTTARAVFCSDTKMFYTIETSNWSYFSQSQKKNVLFNDKIWEELGLNISKSLAVLHEIGTQKKELRKRRKQQGKQLQHGSSEYIKAKSKKNHFKTQQSLNQTSRSEQNLFKNKLIAISTQKNLEADSKEPKIPENKTKQSLSLSNKSQIFGPSKQRQIQRVQQQQQIQPINQQDSDQSQLQDMQKQKFKKYINVATRMFIQFERAYYGQQYTVKSRYEIPKQKPQKKKQRQVPIIQQACLKGKIKSEFNQFSQGGRSLTKFGISEQKITGKSINRLDRSAKKVSFRINPNEIQTKEEIIKSFPKIVIINTTGNEQKLQRKQVKMPKLEANPKISLKKI